MFDAALMTQIVAYCANGIAIAMSLSPVMQIVKLCKTKNPNQVSELTFIVMTMNSVLWFSNFYRNPNFWAIFPHYFGIPFNLTFFSIFVLYKYRFWVSALMISCSWGLIILIMTLLIAVVPRTPLGDSFIAYTAMVVNIAIAFSPMQKLPYVFKTGDYTVIPVFMNYVVILSSCIWGLYAVLLNNVPLLVPQIAIVAICSITQTVYYVFQYKASKAPKKAAAEPVPVDSESAKKLGVDVAESTNPTQMNNVVRKQSMVNDIGKGNLVIKIEGRN